MRVHLQSIKSLLARRNCSNSRRGRQSKPAADISRLEDNHVVLDVAALVEERERKRVTYRQTDRIQIDKDRYCDARAVKANQGISGVSKVMQL